MITFHAFGRVHPLVHGLTRDLRVQWALEELELPYHVHGLDHTGGEMSRDEFLRLSPFKQLPVIEDDGFVLAESGAILVYLADKAGRLADPQSTSAPPWRAYSTKPTSRSDEGLCYVRHEQLADGNATCSTLRWHASSINGTRCVGIGERWWRTRKTVRASSDSPRAFLARTPRRTHPGQTRSSISPRVHHGEADGIRHPWL